jgi:hypothetical protein
VYKLLSSLAVVKLNISIGFQAMAFERVVMTSLSKGVDVLRSYKKIL